MKTGSVVVQAMLGGLLLAAGCMTEAGDEADPPELASVVIDSPHGELTVDVELRDGLAILEGDMVVGTADEARAGTLFSAGRRLATYRWPDGVIPYVLDPTYNTDQKEAIEDAMDQWRLLTQYRFVLRTTQADYVYFLNDSSNNSSIGRQGGKQFIRVAGTRAGTIMHEIGHTIGLWHEQSRSDRDQHVTIHWQNIPEDREHNFQTYLERGSDGRDLFPYDLTSIMHYSSTAFSDNGEPTITRKDGSTFEAQREYLTDGDISGAMRLLTYSEGQTTFKSVNDATGRCLDVQAASYLRGAPVNNYQCHGGDNQRWLWWYMPSNGAYLIINQKSGMCLDYRQLVSGTRLEQRPCDGWLGQRWQINTRLRPASNTTWCVQARTDWTATIERCDGGTDQDWRFTL